MRSIRLFALACLLAATAARAQDGPLKVETLKEAPPKALAGPVKEALNGQGYRIVDAQGKAFADVWLRKATPASGKPSGPKGAILFPVLADGELLGAVRFSAEGHDYRDQAIAAGVYTMRYGLQPVNGDHLGVSENRDYALLVPAAKDTSLTDLPRKALETQSAEAAGTNHPAVFILLAPPEGSKDEPAMVNDPGKMTWGLVAPLPLAVKGESAGAVLRVQLVVSGAAPH
jgi:hypothetical protein